MLTVRNRKKVEFVFVAGTLLLILLAEPVLAKRVRKRVTKSNQVGIKNQKSSNNGQASDKVSTSSQKATQETQLSTSWRNNSGRTKKTVIHKAGNAKHRRVSRWTKQRQPREGHFKKQDAAAQLRSSSRVRKRWSFDTRKRMFLDKKKRLSLDTKRRMSLDTKRRITVFDMKPENKQPAPKRPPHRIPRHRKRRPDKSRPIAQK